MDAVLQIAFADLFGACDQGGDGAADLPGEELREPGAGEEDEERDQGEHEQVSLADGAIGGVEFRECAFVYRDLPLFLDHIDGQARGHIAMPMSCPAMDGLPSGHIGLELEVEGRPGIVRR